MRRPFIRAALLILLMCIHPAALCEASAPLTVTAQANPASMVLAQDAVFTFLLQNTADVQLSNIEVLFPEANGSQSVGDIAPGASAEVEFSCPVTDDDLTAGGITFSVTGTRADGASMPDTEVTVPVSREAERPEVEFTRQISSRYVHAGEEATLVYQVKNTGNVALTALELNDALGPFTCTLEVLEPGETQTFISRVPMNGSGESMPTLRFSSGASGQSYTKSLSGATIALAEESIQAILSVDRTQVDYGDAVTLTLTLTNGGNVSFSDIILSDHVLGILENEPLSLSSGDASVSIARSCVIKSDTTFCVDVSGKTDAGKPFSVTTEPVTVSVNRTEGTSDLVLTAEPSARSLSVPGTVSFKLTLTNNGRSDLAQVTLSEAERGVIRLFDIVPAGAPTVREQMYDVTGDSTFRFIAEITDSQGAKRIVTSEEITITVANTDATAAGTSGISALLHTHAFRIGSVSVYPMMIAGTLLLLVLLVLIFVITGRKHRRTRDANRAERQKRSELLGRTNRFTPVSRNRNNKEGKR